MPKLAPLTEIANYHTDTEESLRHYYSPSYPGYPRRFYAYLASEISTELMERIAETEMRSVLVILARVEAAFRRDYKARATSKNSDPISIAFRKLYNEKGERVRLEDEILDVWRAQLQPASRQSISDLRGMLKYRHWLAHGRHWNQGRPHSYRDAYLLADVILSGLSLLG